MSLTDMDNNQIRDFFLSQAHQSGHYAIAYAIMAIKDVLMEGDDLTLSDAIWRVSGSLDEIATAINDIKNGGV